MIAAGDLDTEIEIFESSRTRDTIGGQTEGNPEKVADDWAEVVALEGAERWRAQQVHASLTHRVRIRRRRDVRASQRIRYEDFEGLVHTLEVLTVVQVSQDELRLLCAEDLETQVEA